jgi:hypothetical protein
MHAYLGAESAPPPPLFAEGAAVAFSCDWDGLPLPGVAPGWRDLVDPAPGSPQFFSLYPLAGQLVSHLVTKFGLGKFVRFYRSIAGNVTADVIAARFMAAFGVTLDEVRPQATAADRPICLSLWECSQPELALDGTTTSIGMTCGLDLVPRTVRLAEPGNLFGWFRNAGSNPSIAGRCGDSSTTGVLSLWPGGSFHLQASLAKGTYVTRLGGAELSLTTPAYSSIGSSCADLTQRPLTAGDLPLLVVAPGDRVQYARFGFAKQPAVVAPTSPSTSLRICGGCAVDPSTCPLVTNGSEARATLDGESGWTMQTGSPWIVIRLGSQ